MGSWVQIKEDYDYRHPSGAITAFKAGSKVHVKNDISEKLIEDKVAGKTTKPKAGDPEHETSGAILETDRTRTPVRRVKSNFAGYPSIAARRAAAQMAAARELGADDDVVTGDRIEEPEITVADNETLAKQLEREEAGKA
jgi:hypothetical protein